MLHIVLLYGGADDVFPIHSTGHHLAETEEVALFAVAHAMAVLETGMYIRTAGGIADRQTGHRPLAARMVAGRLGMRIVDSETAAERVGHRLQFVGRANF